MRRIIFVGTTSDECEAERKTIFEQQSSEKGNKERPNKKKKWIPKQKKGTEGGRTLASRTIKKLDYVSLVEQAIKYAVTGKKGK